MLFVLIHFLWEERTTGCFKANIYILIGDCGKYTMCTEKIVVDLFSVHTTINQEKINSRNLNWKLGPFFP